MRRPSPMLLLAAPHPGGSSSEDDEFACDDDMAAELGAWALAHVGGARASDELATSLAGFRANDRTGELAGGAESDNEEVLEDLFSAAGFDDAPVVTMMGQLEASLPVAELARQLANLANRPSRPPTDAIVTNADAVHTLLTAGFHEDALLFSLCDVDAAPIGTLVIAFGGLVQGMGGIAKHEFVGVCKRAGASALFVRGLSESASTHSRRIQSASTSAMASQTA